MFNDDELEFIDQAAERDLKAINQRIESITNEMANLGKMLCDLKTNQSRLMSIKQAIKDEKEDNER